LKKWKRKTEEMFGILIYVLYLQYKKKTPRKNIRNCKTFAKNFVIGYLLP
jgi:hypothetical protein